MRGGARGLGNAVPAGLRSQYFRNLRWLDRPTRVVETVAPVLRKSLAGHPRQSLRANGGATFPLRRRLMYIIILIESPKMTMWRQCFAPMPHLRNTILYCEATIVLQQELRRSPRRTPNEFRRQSGPGSRPSA